MRRPHPGWMIAGCAAILSASTWLPWRTTAGGRANALGGVVGNLPPTDGFGAGQLILLLASALLVAGAMVGRGLSTKVSSIVALSISLLAMVLVVWYRQHYVAADMSAGYGLYLGAASAMAAAACSVWALMVALRR